MLVLPLLYRLGAMFEFGSTELNCGSNRPCNEGIEEATKRKTSLPEIFTHIEFTGTRPHAAAHFCPIIRKRRAIRVSSFTLPFYRAHNFDAEGKGASVPSHPLSVMTLRARPPELLRG